MSEAEKVVREFCEAMKTYDAESIRPYLTEDAFFYIQGTPAACGADAIVANIAWQMSMFPKGGYWYEIVNLAENGNIVMVERVDWTFAVKNGYLVGNPILGVFELENGKIKRWFDYWDNYGQVISSAM